MELVGFAFALLILVALNYWAGRAARPLTARLALITTSLPALALVGFTGWKLGYAIVNAREVNRRFQEGDLTYFGADMAFAVSLAPCAVWVLAAYAGYRLGQRNRRLNSAR
jgi:hypothetical protein